MTRIVLYNELLLVGALETEHVVEVNVHWLLERDIAVDSTNHNIRFFVSSAAMVQKENVETKASEIPGVVQGADEDLAEVGSCFVVWLYDDVLSIIE